MSDRGPYSPKYTQTDNVPVVGPDHKYGVELKRSAIKKAEAQAEMDITDGDAIPIELQVPIVLSAIEELATFYILRDPTQSSDVTLQALQDGDGDENGDAQQFRDEYDQIIDTISTERLGNRDGSYIGTESGGGTVRTVGTSSSRDEL